MKHKKGFEINSTMVGIAVVVTAFLLLFMIIPGLLKKSSGGALDTIKKWAGSTSESDLENQKEGERVNEELKENAENAYLRFESNIKKCMEERTKNVPCLCPTIDFGQLNEFSLKITNSGENKILELLDQKLVPVGNRKSILGDISFVPGDLDDGFYAAAELDFYGSPTSLTQELLKSNMQYFLFSKDKLAFNGGRGDIEKLEGGMDKLRFIKLRKGITLGHSGKERKSPQEIMVNIQKDTLVMESQDFGFKSCI